MKVRTFFPLPNLFMVIIDGMELWSGMTNGTQERMLTLISRRDAAVLRKSRTSGLQCRGSIGVRL